jgi:hypothetical protein
MRRRREASTRALLDCRPLQNRLLAALPTAEYTGTRSTMDPSEAQARAIIAAALIVRGAVEIPSMPSGSRPGPDSAGIRLRELTDYVYRLVTIGEPDELE